MRRACAVAASGGLLTLLALMFDAAPLFVPGIALAALGVFTPAWTWLGARGITVRRTLQADRVIEGEPVEAKIEITRGRLRPPGLELVDPIAGETVWERGSLPVRGAGAGASVALVTRLPRRGRHTFGPPSVIVRDPLELARVVRTGEGADEVLVLPHTERVNWRGGDLGAAAHLSAGSNPSEPLAAAELDGLRPYRVGTPASRIHWAALARGAGLLERRLKPDADTRPLVVLDARCSDAETEDLDAAVRAAASLTLELARRGGCSLLLPGERRATEIDPELRAWPAAHARLAVVHGGPAGRAPGLTHGSRLGRVFYVAAQAPRRVPQLAARGGPLAAVLVVPKAQRAHAHAQLAFEVAGCRGYVLRPAPRAAAGRRAVA